MKAENTTFFNGLLVARPLCLALIGYLQEGQAMKRGRLTADDIVVPKHVYHLDDDGHVTGTSPVGCLDEPASGDWDRLYLLDTHDPETSSYIDILCDKHDALYIHEFCEDATLNDLETLFDYCHQKHVIDLLTQRWGEMRVRWGGPDSEPTTLLMASLTVYFDEGMGFAFMENRPAERRAYTQLIEDFRLLRSVFDSAVKKQGRRR